MLSVQNSRTAVDLKSLVEDPRFYVFDTLPKQNKTRFLITTEDELAHAPFADIRFDNRSREDFYASSHQLQKYCQGRARPETDVFFIFHHAFVCSTLLARCLNQIDAFYALKEPWILRRMADLKRGLSTSARKKDWQKKSEMHLRLLCKRYASGSSLVIKPTNVANNLIGDVCHWMPRTRVLYLFSSLEKFLISNLKKNDETKAKIPGLLQTFLSDSNIVSQCQPLSDFRDLNFSQTCAAIWIANIYLLKVQYDKLPPGRIHVLDMDVLLESPETALRSVSQYFGHLPTSGELAELTSADVLGAHAKALIHRPFNTAIRAQEDQQVRNAHSSEIRVAMEWAKPLIESLQLEQFLQKIDLTGKDVFSGVASAV